MKKEHNRKREKENKKKEKKKKTKDWLENDVKALNSDFPFF